MPRPICCAFCGATSRDVRLWDQIIHMGRGVICCNGVDR